MNDMVLVKSANFNGIELDCYVEPEQEDRGNFWATREQIGELLGYSEPRISISNIHQRNQERLDKFSRVHQFDLPSGGIQSVTVYNFKGLLEICRYSQQPNANTVIDWLWDVADEIRLTGSYSVKRKRKSVKKTAPSLGSMIDACEKIYNKALHCESNDDVRKVLAMDEAFKHSTGESALDIAHFTLNSGLDADNNEMLNLTFNHPELLRIKEEHERIKELLRSAEYLNMLKEMRYEERLHHDTD